MAWFLTFSRSALGKQFTLNRWRQTDRPMNKQTTIRNRKKKKGLYIAMQKGTRLLISNL